EPLECRVVPREKARAALQRLGARPLARGRDGGHASEALLRSTRHVREVLPDHVPPAQNARARSFARGDELVLTLGQALTNRGAHVHASTHTDLWSGQNERRLLGKLAPARVPSSLGVARPIAPAAIRLVGPEASGWPLDRHRT